MANLKDIRKRIASVKNTQQITRAMKLVAAAKLRRAQEAIINARPYAYRIYAILLSLVKADSKHPLLEVRPEKKIRVIVLAGDRGLCGSFNANIFKKAVSFLKEKDAQGVEITLECIGKRTNDFFKGKRTVSANHEGILARPSFFKIQEIANGVIKDYLEESLDATYLIYNEFKSAIVQRVVVERLIPISTEVPEGVVGIRKHSGEDEFAEYLFEPSKKDILEAVIPRHFQTQLFRAVLESVAAEHGARMSAMESATNNASDVIGSLTLEYNKARQASITKELMEIIGGAEAMK